MSQLDEIRARHHPGRNGAEPPPGWCAEGDARAWPCDAAVLLAGIAHAKRLIDGACEDMDAYARLIERRGLGPITVRAWLREIDAALEGKPDGA